MTPPRSILSYPGSASGIIGLIPREKRREEAKGISVKGTFALVSVYLLQNHTLLMYMNKSATYGSHTSKLPKACHVCVKKKLIV
jgi:hypothetical protein